jgi:hypothetical protein
MPVRVISHAKIHPNFFMLPERHNGRFIKDLPSQLKP